MSTKLYTVHRNYSIEPFEIGIAILQSILDWCSAMKLGPGKTPIFNWLPWQRPLKNQKSEMSKPLHPSTNPEILVKIGPLDSELLGLESRPLKE